MREVRERDGVREVGWEACSAHVQLFTCISRPSGVEFGWLEW